MYKTAMRHAFEGAVRHNLGKCANHVRKVLNTNSGIKGGKRGKTNE